VRPLRTTRIAALAVVAAASAGLGPCSGEELAIWWSSSSGNSLELVYSMRGGQTLGSVEVDEDDDRVTVSARAEGCLTECGGEDEQVFGCVLVELDEPLGSRELIDATTDRPPQAIPPDAPRPRRVPCRPPP
jgi:hypothetical protein